MWASFWKMRGRGEGGRGMREEESRGWWGAAVLWGGVDVGGFGAPAGLDGCVVCGVVFGRARSSEVLFRMEWRASSCSREGGRVREEGM